MVSPVFDHYSLQVSTVSTFNADTLLYDEQMPTSSFTLPDDLAPGRTYYWRVSAVNYLDGRSSWASRSFKTGWLPPKNLVDPADPVNPVNSNRPDFTWQPVDQATSYNLQVSKSTGFSTTVLSVTVTGSTYRPTADLPADTPLYWRMRTAGTNGPSAWSDHNSFKTPKPPAIPILSVPTNGILVNTYTPLLDWSTVSVPADTTFGHYDVEVSRDSSFATKLTINPITDGAQSTFTFAEVLDDNATYYWRVMATNTLDQYSSWSNVSSFRTPMKPPVMDLPVDGGHVLTVRPQFVWEPVDTATSYTIQVSKSSTFTSTVVNATVTGTSYIPTSDLPRYSATAPLLTGASEPTGPSSAWSDVSGYQFTPANPPAVPSLSLPAASTVISNYRYQFTWGNVSGANDGYQIQIATSNLFTDDSLITLHDNGDSPTNSFTPDADLPVNDTLYWRVKSLNMAGEYSFWSAPRTFKTTLPAPVLLAPTPDETNVALLPTFTWEDVAGVTGYTIQVSTGSSFSSTVINQTLTEATFKATTSSWQKNLLLAGEKQRHQPQPLDQTRDSLRRRRNPRLEGIWYKITS